MHALKVAVLLPLLFAASPAGAGERIACTEADLARSTRAFEGRVVSLRRERKWTEASLVVAKALKGETGKRVTVHINIMKQMRLTLTRGARYRLHVLDNSIGGAPWVICGQRLPNKR